LFIKFHFILRLETLELSLSCPQSKFKYKLTSLNANLSKILAPIKGFIVIININKEIEILF